MTLDENSKISLFAAAATLVFLMSSAIAGSFWASRVEAKAEATENRVGRISDAIIRRDTKYEAAFERITGILERLARVEAKLEKGEK